MPEAPKTFSSADLGLTPSFHSNDLGFESRKKPELSPVDKAFKVVEDAGGSVLDSPVGQALAWAGDKVDRYVDAPVRAQIGALQNGSSFWDSVKAGGKQLGKAPLPSTPSGKDIMAQTGLSTRSLSDVAPSLFSATGEGMALKKGGLLDVSPAGIAGGLTQPSMFAIPAEAISGLAGKTAAGVAKAGTKAAEVLEPLAVDLGKAGQIAQKGVFKVGEALTGGNLKVADAMKAANQLSGRELLLPEAYLKGAGKKVGAARDAIEAASKGTATEDLQLAKASGEAKGLYGGFTAKDAEALAPKTLVAPGGEEVLSRVRDILVAGEKKAAKTPGSTALLERVDEALSNPHGVPVEAVDDIIRDLNGVQYTEKGNPRSIEARWAKPLGEIRGELEPLLKATPEGAALSAAKEPFHALKVAQGPRSKLMGGLSWGSAVTGGATALATSNPALAAVAVAASRAIAPRTYFQIVGAAKLPADAVRGLMTAYESGSAMAIREAMAGVAEKYPQEAARISQALLDRSAEAANVADKDRKNRAMKRRLSE